MHVYTPKAFLVGEVQNVWDQYTNPFVGVSCRKDYWTSLPRNVRVGPVIPDRAGVIIELGRGGGNVEGSEGF